MNRSKRQPNVFMRHGLFASLIVLCAVCLGGCASLKPGADPLVVRAEQTSLIAFELMDMFLKWEHENRNVLSEDIRQAATKMRLHAPAALTALRVTTKAYKSNRTEQNKVDLLTVLAVVESMQSEAVQILGQYKRVTP